MAKLAFVICILALVCGIHCVLFPDPDHGHKFKVAVSSFALNDMARKDPWNNKEHRKFMVSLFMPVTAPICTRECTELYMNHWTGRVTNQQFFGDPDKGIFEDLSYKTCCDTDKFMDASSIPVVVLDPHTDTTRLLYSNLARYISANGVAVLLIDHTYDSSAVMFPKNRVPQLISGKTKLSSLGTITVWNETVTNAIDIRIQDIHFALKSLDIATLKAEFPFLSFSKALDISSYAIVGHGLGGTVATSLSISDPRVCLSINLSGSAPPLNTTTQSPIYFLGRANFRREHDINWPSTWSHLTGTATEYDLADSEIFDFSDMPIVLELAKGSDWWKDTNSSGLGKIGPRGNHAVKCFVEAIVREKILGQKHEVRNCVALFGDDSMIPYLGGEYNENRMGAVKKSAAVRLEVYGGLMKKLRTWVTL
ncbi:hypothetical protein GQ44DRAFT_722536 [Phaeosphaeriaceae sp. PMI808]|nr:hypothetical protein GQ44DRAFT_722536 [Phaeosphaeriaceae sp. PMI808]